MDATPRARYMLIVGSNVMAGIIAMLSMKMVARDLLLNLLSLSCLSFAWSAKGTMAPA